MQTIAATQTRAKARPHVAAKTGGTTHRVQRKADATTFYVTALKEAGGFHKQSFYIEMAVCLAFYFEQKKADMPAKKLLRPIYEKAGYDCKLPKGDDYKTVQRRISAAADLYTFVGGEETIVDWAEGATGAKMLSNLVEKLEGHKLDSIAAVKDYAGKPVVRQYKKREATPSAADIELGKQVDAGIEAAKVLDQAGKKLVEQLPPERILRTEHIFCAVPLDATQDEVKSLALMLLEFATTKMAVPAPAAPAEKLAA